jgi:hypothetical protein
MAQLLTKGVNLMNKCALCEQTFDLWIIYKMHLEGHQAKAPEHSRKRCIVGVKTPVSDNALAAIVRRVEDKLGAAIVGMLLMATLFIPIVHADDDDGEHGQQGIQGPIGPAGPQGSRGVNGMDGKQGAQGTQGNQGAQGEAAPSAHMYGGLGLNLTLYDSQYVTVGLFNTTYAAPSNWGSISGVSLSFAIGKSYTERLIDKQQKRIEALERALATTFVAK